jgi:hypothetical protein
MAHIGTEVGEAQLRGTAVRRKQVDESFMLGVFLQQAVTQSLQRGKQVRVGFVLDRVAGERRVMPIISHHRFERRLVNRTNFLPAQTHRCACQ